MHKLHVYKHVFTTYVSFWSDLKAINISNLYISYKGTSFLFDLNTAELCNRLMNMSYKNSNTSLYLSCSKYLLSINTTQHEILSVSELLSIILYRIFNIYIYHLIQNFDCIGLRNTF